MDPILGPRYEFYKPNPVEDCESRTGLEWLRLILQITFLFLTVFGNLLVIISIVVVKVLHHPKNYLILSLAVADLLVGIFVLPLKIILTENCDIWKSGKVVCYIWISGDVMCCTASILGLTAISLDRYTAIAHPLFYRANNTSNKAYIAIAATWIAAFLLTVPHWMLAELHYDLKFDDSGNNLAICFLSHRPWHQIVGVIGFFFLPLGVMIFVHAKIGRILRMHRAKNPQKAKTSQPTESASVGAPTASADPDTEQPPSCVLMARISEVVQERKGCIMMAIVLGVFTLCWFPFFTLMLVNGISELLDNPVDSPQWVYELPVWLGYINSCANPVIYTMFNQDFRYAFTEFICLRGSTLNSRIRSEMYSKQIGSSSGTNHSTISSRNNTGRQQVVNVPFELS